MTKEELEAKRQAHAEAFKAFKAGVEEYKAGRPSDSDVTAEEWSEKATEKIRTAREAFVKVQNELIAIDAQADVNKYEHEIEEWENRPATRVPGLHDTEDAQLDTVEQRYESRLMREAFSLERASAGHRSRAASNEITMFKNAAPAYRYKDEKEREAYKKWFGASIRNAPGSGGLMLAHEELKATVGDERFALLTSTGELGGYLVDDDFQAMVIKDLVGLSTFRQVARVMRTGKDVAVFPTIVAPTAANAKKGFPSKWAGGWGAQADQGGNATLSTQNQPTFGQERIQIHRYQPQAVELSLETLEDPDADVASILAEIMAETRAIDENAAFTEGTGADRPLGITKEALTAAVSGAASTITFAGLLTLVGTLPAQYRRNGTMMMNSLTYTTALGLENASTGHSLVFPQPTQASIGGTGFGSLMTYRVAFNEYMPAIGANAYPIIYGDFSYYYIVDRMEMRVQRLIEKVAPNVAFLAIARLGGQTVRQNAFIRHKCST